MRVSTNQFLLGSLNDMLNQQANVNTLNREIATGQTLLDASTDPSGASQALGAANSIAQYSYDSANAAAASQSLGNGVSALQQVTTVLDQLQQTAIEAASVSAAPADRQALAQTAQGALQQLVQLANTRGPDGSYLFAGSKAGTVPFSTQTNGQVVFNGDGGSNSIEIAPSLSVPSTITGSGIFTGIPAGNDGVAVSAAGTNNGAAYALAVGVTNVGQMAAARLAGTQYAISFGSGSGGGLSYTVTSGSGAPGSAGFAASSGIVASGNFTAGSDLSFGGVDIRITGSPAAGDVFDVQTNATTTMFQTVQDLVAALQSNSGTPSANAQLQQQVENVLANVGNAQTSALTAQASLGSSLTEIQAVQQQNASLSAGAQSQLSNLQSANLPQVMANYSESLTALQAAQLAFAKVQNLTLFNYIKP